MRALVIGATGGIGSAVYEQLQSDGWDVTGLSRSVDGFDVGNEASIKRGLERLEGPFDLIFANILARPLPKLAPKLAPLIAKSGHVILSGLLTHQEPLVRAAYTGRGLTLVKRIRKDGWSTLVLKRPV